MAKDLKKAIKGIFPKKITPGEAIRAKRKNYGITLEEISEVTGIDSANLSAIENGTKKVGFRTAQKIGLAIGLDPMTILYPNGFDQDESEKLKEIARKGETLLKRKMVA